MADVRLTHYSRAGGCGCKVSAAFLRELISRLPSSGQKSPLVGIADFDDAGAIALDSKTALLLTVDAFTPLFDDPRTFGRVSAANALSDIYAMGATPVLAQAFLGWPVSMLGSESAAEVVSGAMELCDSVNVPLSGGHTIDSVEPIFGLCVNGLSPIANIKRKGTARVGDILFLTKPLGAGIISTAEKKSVLISEDRNAALQIIAQPNIFGAQLGCLPFVTALTDVTGFGLGGNLLEMALAADLMVDIDFRCVHVMQGVRTYIDSGCTTSGGARNAASFGAAVHVPSSDIADLVFDPQTNGGLLIACEASRMEDLKALMVSANLENFVEPIGRFVSKGQDESAVRIRISGLTSGG